MLVFKHLKTAFSKYNIDLAPSLFITTIIRLFINVFVDQLYQTQIIMGLGFTSTIEIFTFAILKNTFIK